MDDDSGDELPYVETKGQKSIIGKRAYRARKKKFVGWGSENLIGFLKSIGKSTDAPFTMNEVSKIVKDYILDNKLRHSEKKTMVVCDKNLKFLFGRKKLTQRTMMKMLEAHFVENQESEDNSPVESEQENYIEDIKRQRKSFDRKNHAVPANDISKREAQSNCYASIVEKNVKLIYLRRSLIEQFLKDPKTFENKVTNCFVRVRSDTDEYSVPANLFHLELVTGVGRTSEPYKIGDICIDVILRISNVMKDIHIFMLSDDDFSEEECNDLRQRVKVGLIRRFTVAELDKKAKSLHEEIINHWIDREIVVLQKKIDRANEKGWRRELFEHIERRQLLQRPEERLRLLGELPNIIADVEAELEAASNCLHDEVIAPEGNKEFSNQAHADKESKDFSMAINEKDVDSDPKDFGATVSSSSPYDIGHPTDDFDKMEGLKNTKVNGATLLPTSSAVGTEECAGSIYSFFFEKSTGCDDVALKGAAKEARDLSIPELSIREDEMEKSIGHDDVALKGSAKEARDLSIPEDEMEDDAALKGAATGAEARDSSIAQDEMEKSIGLDDVAPKGAAKEARDLSIPEDEMAEHKKKEGNKGGSTNNIIILDDDVNDSSNRAKGAEQMMHVIDLEDEDEEENVGVSTYRIAENYVSCRKENAQTMENDPNTLKIWNYIDPNGEAQGPFSIFELKVWKNSGWFDEDFMVWATGRSPDDSITLKDAIRLTTV